MPLSVFTFREVLFPIPTCRLLYALQYDFLCTVQVLIYIHLNRICMPMVWDFFYSIVRFIHTSNIKSLCTLYLISHLFIFFSPQNCSFLFFLDIIYCRLSDLFRYSLMCFVQEVFWKQISMQLIQESWRIRSHNSMLCNVTRNPSKEPDRDEGR